MLFINCTESNENKIKECTLRNTSMFYESGIYISLGISLFGTLLNLVALLVFAFSKDMTFKFLHYLKYSVVNSFVVTANYLTMVSLILLLNGSDFGNQHKIHSPVSFSSYEFVSYYSYIFKPVWTVTYSFGSFLDIAIAYERILMYLRNLKFLRSINLYVSLLSMIVISCLINLPTILSIDVYDSTLNFSTANLTFKIYWWDNRIYQYNLLFTVCLYVINFMRDIIMMVVELAVTVFLIINIVKFYNKKKKLKTLKLENQKEKDRKTPPDPNRKIDMNNSKISL